MKKLLLIALMFSVFGCGQELQSTEDDDGVVPELPNVLVTNVLLDGEPVHALQWVFYANDRGFTVRSREELSQGLAYDSLAKETVKYVDVAVSNDGTFREGLFTGNYFVVVMISDDRDGRYSFTSVTIKENEELVVEKDFKAEGDRYSFEAWD